MIKIYRSLLCHIIILYWPFMKFIKLFLPSRDTNVEVSLKFSVFENELFKVLMECWKTKRRWRYNTGWIIEKANSCEIHHYSIFPTGIYANRMQFRHYERQGGLPLEKNPTLFFRLETPRIFFFLCVNHEPHIMNIYATWWIFINFAKREQERSEQIRSLCNVVSAFSVQKSPLSLPKQTLKLRISEIKKKGIIKGVFTDEVLW